MGTSAEGKRFFGKDNYTEKTRRQQEKRKTEFKIDCLHERNNRCESRAEQGGLWRPGHGRHHSFIVMTQKQVTITR